MNPAFQEALAARLLWVDVVALESIEGCEARTEAALQAAYDAVHALASNDVLTYRHYGPRAPLLLQDVPELADQYNLAHELYTELYFTNYQNGSIGTLSEHWLKPGVPLAQPYSQWLAAVTTHIAQLMGVTCSQASDATSGQTKCLLLAWGRGEPVQESAVAVLEAYECLKEWEKELEEEEAHRKHLEDLADTYNSIEAELWAGWREDCSDMGMAA
ncbi:hypothetical protein H8F21_14170 [Pseudomonas sp. P66]|uniref:Thiaminase-2/PQQC domain-containing protein n=1 Tax=Pseudomonas arcuscaelestis TaxID=2710591 RepID=A0ABS2BZ00_9PSED|nr:hypothetical protein [Pseudomonas arcuscaelestis]MBM5458710.1 hypothetical protein [Pseudomonas arcuscaelestis]